MRVEGSPITTPTLNHMSRVCEVCGKGSMMVTKRKLLRGNLNPTSKRRKFPNLQTLRLGGGKVKACTRCLRTLKREVAKMEAEAK
jgi:ribosomal protein L28